MWAGERLVDNESYARKTLALHLNVVRGQSASSGDGMKERSVKLGSSIKRKTMGWTRRGGNEGCDVGIAFWIGRNKVVGASRGFSLTPFFTQWKPFLRDMTMLLLAKKNG